MNQFELLEPLGKGGMGEVFLAQDSKLDRKVAIKFLPDALKKDPIARERFLRESKLAAALDHPYICKIYEIGEVEGKAFIAMEYVEGQTLQRRLKKGPLRLNQLLGLGMEIAEAIDMAEQVGRLKKTVPEYAKDVISAEARLLSRIADRGPRESLPTYVFLAE